VFPLDDLIQVTMSADNVYTYGIGTKPTPTLAGDVAVGRVSGRDDATAIRRLSDRTRTWRSDKSNKWQVGNCKSRDRVRLALPLNSAQRQSEQISHSVGNEDVDARRFHEIQTI
jgi:hypothetical protein